MILRYGSYSHDLGETKLGFTRVPEYTSRGYRKGTRHTVTISGTLRGENPGELTAAYAALYAAYSRNGQDLSLHEEDGTLTAVRLQSNAMLGGTRVTQFPSLPDLSGAAYVTWLPYTIAVEGFEADPESSLLNFRESLTITGNGGPRRVVIETANGAPVVQITRQRTKVTAVQSGTATGYRTIPPIPPPLFPSYEDQDQRTIADNTATSVRGKPDERSVSWSYRFTSPNPLSGTATQL